MSRPLPFAKLDLEVGKQHVAFPLNLKEPCVSQLVAKPQKKKKKRTTLCPTVWSKMCMFPTKPPEVGSCLAGLEQSNNGKPRFLEPRLQSPEAAQAWVLPWVLRCPFDRFGLEIAGSSWWLSAIRFVWFSGV